MPPAGTLRDRIVLQRHDTATDQWLDLETLPEVSAAVTALGDERYTIVVRYREDLHGLQDAAPALRVLYRGRTLDVVDIRETAWRQALELTGLAHRVPIPDLSSPARQTTTWPQP
jgi:Phage head-tail joining protein